MDKQIELAQVCMHKPAILVQPPYEQHQLCVVVLELLGIQLGILQGNPFPVSLLHQTS